MCQRVENCLTVTWAICQWGGICLFISVCLCVCLYVCVCVCASERGGDIDLSLREKSSLFVN